MESFWNRLGSSTLLLVAIAGLCLVGCAAFADEPTTMAPPIETSAPSDTGGNAAEDTVFNWQEIPVNQQVPLTRATFDQGGYQLFDTVGETIVVPFTDENLYVMKFARSENGTMYFVNEGDYPVLYVPRHGYLENATVSGARWYPFGKGFHPTEPCYLGIAPSWSAFINMGWYPNMWCHGGYWCNTSYVSGGVFLPSVGLFFDIGGVRYSGWNGYYGYSRWHPAPYHINYYSHNYYYWANRPRSELHVFVGGGRGLHPYLAHRPFAGAPNIGGGHTFQGSQGHSYGGGNGHPFNGDGNQGGGHSHTFGGGNGGGGQYNHGSGNGHAFNGGGQGHPFNGGSGQSNHGGGSGGRTFGGGQSGHGGGSGNRNQNQH